MTTVQLRPDGTYSNSWPIIGGGSADQVLADNYDFSYIKGQFALQSLRLAFGSFVLPAGAVVRSIQPIVRAGVDDPTSAAYFDYQLIINNANTIPTNHLSPNFRSQLGDTPPDVLYLIGLNGHRSQWEIDNLGLSVGSGIVSGITHALLTEMYCNVLYVPAPTTVATGPTGTLTINNPTVTWVHQPGADAPGGQDAYRVVVYDIATGGVVYDTGNVASAAQSAVVGPLALQHTYVAYAYSMQTTDGYQQWASSATPTVFTLDVTGPTTDVTGPTGTVGTTSPSVTWTHTPGVGAQTGQTFYRVRAFNVDDLVTALYDSGVVAGAATSAVVGPLDPAIEWRVIVTTAQTTYGVAQWSAGDFTEFDIDVDPALIESVVATPIDSLGAISLLITRDTDSPLWLTIDVEASYDGGEWQPVRGATRLSVNGATATVLDYEPPNDRPVVYRARANRTVAGVLQTGPWVQSTSTTWHLAGNDIVIKDPDHPDRNMRVCLAVAPDALYDRTVGVFRPIGAHYPVVVSDVLQAPSLTATVLTHTADEAAAFLAVAAAPVLLVQSPDLPWGWGSRYVAMGAIAQTRTGPVSRKADRLWAVTMVEVARPADESAT